MANNLIGQEKRNEIQQLSQVYLATHDGAGSRLPYAKRSFISFSYGGKNIEDFGLLVVTDGNRLNQNVYTNFENLTTNYDVIDGQFYWGTHFTGKTINMTLATDGITDKQLDEFKSWFKPGVCKPLILAEHPNRMIMARVAESPRFSFLPFGETTYGRIDNIRKYADVTVYKGEIEISFICDSPYWEGLYSFIPPYIVGGLSNEDLDLGQDPYILKKFFENNLDKIFTLFQKGSEKGVFIKIKGFLISDDYAKYSINGDNLIDQTSVKTSLENWWSIKYQVLGKDDKIMQSNYPEDIASMKMVEETEDNSDYLKVSFEDNIPFLNSITSKYFLLGNSNLDELDIQYFDLIVSKIDFAKIGVSKIDYNIKTSNLINKTKNMFENINFKKTDNNLSVENPLYLFYSGNAPSKPILQFTFTPCIVGKSLYIYRPYSKQYSPKNIEKSGYHYISVGDKKFYFTLPSFLTGYNQIAAILKKFKAGDSAEDFRKEIRDKVNDYYMRAHALACLDLMIKYQKNINNDGSLNQEFFNYGFLTRVVNFISQKFVDWKDVRDRNSETSITCLPVNVLFNSETGEAIATFKCRKLRSVSDLNEETAAVTNFDTNIVWDTNYQYITENVGDMVVSDYLTLDERTYQNPIKGKIYYDNCLEVKTNYPQTLTNFGLYFKNMYY